MDFEYIWMVDSLSEGEKKEFLADMMAMATSMGFDLEGVNKMSTREALYFLGGVLGLTL